MAGRFWWIPLAVAAIAALIWGDAGALPGGGPGPREPLGDLTEIVSSDATVRAGLPEDRTVHLPRPSGLPREAIVELASRAARGACGYTFADLNAMSHADLVALQLNTPNPFGPTTAIAFTLSAPSHTRVSIYDCRGRLVTVLVAQEHSAGKHILEWRGHDGRGNNVANGVYFCRAEAGGTAEARKMVYMR